MGKREGKVLVDQPKVVGLYNKGMGGVDLLDMLYNKGMGGVDLLDMLYNKGMGGVDLLDMLYNKGMGWVDLLDMPLVSYRPKLRSRKWWWPLFSNALNIALVVAYKLYKHVSPEPLEKQLTHLKFRVEIAEVMARGDHALPMQRLGGPTAKVPNQIRFDAINHYLARSMHVLQSKLSIDVLKMWQTPAKKHLL